MIIIFLPIAAAGTINPRQPSYHEISAIEGKLERFLREKNDDKIDSGE